jgi:hypothetical protein
MGIVSKPTVPRLEGGCIDTTRNALPRGAQASGADRGKNIELYAWLIGTRDLDVTGYLLHAGKRPAFAAASPADVGG